MLEIMNWSYAGDEPNDKSELVVTLQIFLSCRIQKPKSNMFLTREVTFIDYNLYDKILHRNSQ